MFFLSENNLSGLNKTIPIDKDERFVLELMLKAKERKIDNSLILNYFKNSKISYDASVKRKNKVIDELNQKALEKFEIVLIIKSSKQTDSRQSRLLFKSQNRTISLYIFLKETIFSTISLSFDSLGNLFCPPNLPSVSM